jgi:hypothetical protein
MLPKVNIFAVEVAIKGRGSDKVPAVQPCRTWEREINMENFGIMVGRRNPNDRSETFPTVRGIFLTKTWNKLENKCTGNTAVLQKSRAYEASNFKYQRFVIYIQFCQQN